MKKIHIALLFGGKSAEHEVSLMSAKNIFQALDKNKYDITLIGISKAGKWLLLPQQLLLAGINEISAKLQAHQGASSVSLAPACAELSLANGLTTKKQTTFDVLFPILHGPYGEDGSIQGLLKLSGIPFVGASVLGSAIGMDKDIMKRLLREANLPIGQYLVLLKNEKPISFSTIKKKFGLPFFIKPANLGSSVGVSRVNNKKEYLNALDRAFAYDNKILIEEYIQGREIECSVLGNERLIASVPGEVITNTTEHSFYSYEAKYLDEHGAKLVIPAPLAKNKMKEVQLLAINVFKVLACEGMGRVDLFLKKDGSFVVNEINTIPGFTSTSMYPKLWEHSGIPYDKLIDHLIELAFERNKRDIDL